MVRPALRRDSPNRAGSVQLKAMSNGFLTYTVTTGSGFGFPVRPCRRARLRSFRAARAGITGPICGTGSPGFKRRGLQT